MSFKLQHKQIKPITMTLSGGLVGYGYLHNDDNTIYIHTTIVSGGTSVTAAPSATASVTYSDWGCDHLGGTSVIKNFTTNQTIPISTNGVDRIDTVMIVNVGDVVGLIDASYHFEWALMPYDLGLPQQNVTYAYIPAGTIISGVSGTGNISVGGPWVITDNMLIWTEMG